MLLGQVGQAPKEQAGLLSARGLTWLGPGQSTVHSPYFKGTWTTICRPHVSQMFTRSTGLSFFFGLFLTDNS